MIAIDGSKGGGQVLRYALALSMKTKKAFRIRNIRGGRNNPGLRNQHMKCVEAAAEITDAEVEGNRKSSRNLTFSPGEISEKDITIDIGTAGSITLLFQTLLPIASEIDKPVSITVSGGTDVKWSPPADYLKKVALENLKRMGLRAELDVIRRGYYPKGGGKAELTLKPSDLSKTEFSEFQTPDEVEVLSVASNSLKENNVAERQLKSARKTLSNMDFKGCSNYVNSHCPGSSEVIAADTGRSVLGADSLGERGKRSEKVGKEPAERMKELIEKEAPVDPYMADQLIPFMAESGGRLRTTGMTDHIRTGLKTCKRFLEYDVEVERNDGLVELVF